jgi:hypothetical protein
MLIAIEANGGCSSPLRNRGCQTPLTLSLAVAKVKKMTERQDGTY